MIRHKLGRAVQWKEGDAHMVGRVIEVKLDALYGMFGSQGDTLVALSHTRELVSVDERELSDYPSEPIPEPSK